MRATRRADSILWVTPPATATDADVDGVLAELQEHLGGSEPYVLLCDMTNAGILTPLQRRKIASHMEDDAARIRRLVRGLGVIAPSPVMRGVVTALFWIRRPEIPHRIFARRAEAVAWAKSLPHAAETSAI